MSKDRAVSRTDLLKTIEEQKELIQRREQRLRDVIAAYKGVLKEKEALEKSVKALSLGKSKGVLDVPSSRGPPSDAGSDRGRESDRESEDGTNMGKVVCDPLNVNGTEQVNTIRAEDYHQTQEVFESLSEDETIMGKVASDPLNINGTEQVDKDGGREQEIEELQSQVATLSSSMLTLTEEKSKLEASYIAEKKSLKQEIEELQKKCQDITEKMEKQEQESSKSLLDLRNRIRAQQIEREKEQTDHAVMLRELQKLLANERQLKEAVEQQHDESQFNMKEKDHLMKELTSRHEQEMSGLRSQIKNLRDQLTKAQRKSEEPSPVVLSLQKETQELKAQHELLVQQDMNRVKDAEEKAQVYSQQCETRIAELESKLSELSESVGNYERLRFQDQQNIQRLKERVAQLDLENTALADAAQRQSDLPEDSLSDINTMVEKILKLKAQLRFLNSQSEKPINIEELIMDDGDIENPMCKKYREELEQLKDEFERYRLRAQSVLKNKKENTQSKDEEILKEHVNELREKLRAQHQQQEDELEHYRQREDNMRKTLLMVQDKHKQEVSQLQTEHHAQLQEFEEELKKQRERTVSMLAEKEREIETLRSSSTQRLQSDYIMRYRSNYDMGGASSERQSLEDEAVERLLTTPPAGQGEMTLLYFAQEQARKDVDITTLRKQKRELEMALRELQMNSGMKQEQLYEEIDRLKEEVRKLERSKNREGANLEYLKNVTYKFLICHDTAGKQQMLNAITTILQFSPQEKTSVQSVNRSWWTTGS